MPAVPVTHLETCCCYYAAAGANNRRGGNSDVDEGGGGRDGSDSNDDGNDSDCRYSSEGDEEDTECGDGIEAGSVACIYTQLVCVTFFFIWLTSSSGV
jgi:hypothetical protein